MAELNALIQAKHQDIENKIQNATELHQLHAIETNYHSSTNLHRRKVLELKRKFRNINSKTFKDKLDKLESELCQHMDATVQRIHTKRQDLMYKGLTPERMESFHHYVADESTVGGQCSVCIQDVEVGRKVIRLDCKHKFCKECIEQWFADHKTCPNCRQSF